MNPPDGSGVFAYDSEMYIHAAYNVWVTRICQLSPCIIFFYDYLLTFDREVEYIWRRPVTASNMLYIIVRFGGGAILFLTAAAFMSESTSRKFCGFFLTSQGWPSLCVLWAVQLILQLRVYALYRRSKKILIAMAVGFTLEVIAMSTFLGIGIAANLNSNEPLPGIRICAVTNAPNILTYVWLPDIFFGAFLFALAARVGLRRRSLGCNIFRREKKDLIDALVHGNVHYFFCILVVNAVNAGVWQGMGYSLFEASEGFAAAFEIILGCRMVLDLRSAVSNHEGLRLSDSFPLMPSFGAREGFSTLYSAISARDLSPSQGLHQPTEAITPPMAISGQSSRVLIEEGVIEEVR